MCCSQMLLECPTLTVITPLPPPHPTHTPRPTPISHAKHSTKTGEKPLRLGFRVGSCCHETHLEAELTVRRNAAHCFEAVAKMRRDFQMAFATHSHCPQSFVQTPDDEASIVAVVGHLSRF